nr:hypothetical protein [Candidatus Sigynarchaeum springense]
MLLCANRHKNPYHPKTGSGARGHPPATARDPPPLDPRAYLTEKPGRASNSPPASASGHL